MSCRRRVEGDLTLSVPTAEHGVHHTMRAARKRQPHKGTAVIREGSAEPVQAESAACRDRSQARGNPHEPRQPDRLAAEVKPQCFRIGRSDDRSRINNRPALIPAGENQAVRSLALKQPDALIHTWSARTSSPNRHRQTMP